MIKESAKIISQKDNESGGIDFILENDTKLGEVLDFLPNGIINKGETGIGATTLEINCHRNSIIIQPLKSTVELKSIDDTRLFAFNKKKSSGLDKELQIYLTNPKIKFKKIILVIDRLEDLINTIGNQILDYFFLFDEIDYMQGNSSYRFKMETGLDLGKAINNFALVSATHIGFSDPELKGLRTYNFSYLEKREKPVQTYYLTSVKLDKYIKNKACLNQMYSCIHQMLISSESKLLVAINNVNLIKEIADSLIKTGIISNADISLLISENNVKNNILIQKYSGLNISNCKLPTRLNFITSAYFNGYDLMEEDLCLIIYSSPNFKTNLIAANEIKQIYGRNRLKTGTSQFFIFTHDIKEDELKDAEFIHSTEEDWLLRGETSVDVQNCIDKHLKHLTKRNNKNNYFAKFFKEQSNSLELNLSRARLLLTKDNFIEDFFNPLRHKKVNEISFLQIDHLRYYYNYLKEMHVMYKWEIEFEEDGIVKQETFLISVLDRYKEIIFNSGFIEVETKITWPKLTFKPEILTHKEKISIAYHEVESSLKTIPENEINFIGIHKKIFEMTFKQNNYTRKSVVKSILECSSLQQFDLMYEFLKYENFKKSDEYLILKGRLDVREHYTLDTLTEIVSLSLGEKLSKKALKNKSSKKGALLMIRLIYRTKPIHKSGSKSGEKLYKLVRYNPFPFLIKSKKSKKLRSNLL
jgi:hypothetical protein